MSAFVIENDAPAALPGYYPGADGCPYPPRGKDWGRTNQAPPAAAVAREGPLPPAKTDFEEGASRKPSPIWCTLLKRTYDFDILRRECGGTLKVVALVTDRDAAREILERLGHPSKPRPLARARSPDEAA